MKKSNAEIKKYRILLLDTKQSNPNHYICLAIERALRASPDVEMVFRANLGNAFDLAFQNRCNLFLAFDGEELDPFICRRLHSICGVGVLWVTEDPYELPVNLRNAGLFDLVYTNDSASVSAYGFNGRHLPLACDSLFHHHEVLANSLARYDLFFAGTAWPNRVELLQKLIDGVESLRVKFAVSSNPHLPVFDLGLARSSWSWRTPNSQFARFANASRVVLTLHRDFSTSPGAPTAASTPGPRLFEVALAGGFQLVDGSLPEVAQYLEPGREVAVFHGASDALDQLRYYLAHPVERVQMAQAAQKRASEQHTYHARVKQILADVQSLTVRVPPDCGAASRPRVLMVTHNIIGEQPFGGVEVYQDWVRRTLSDKFDVWTYVARAQGRRTILLDDKMREVSRHSFSNDADMGLLSCPEREHTFSCLLEQHDISLVHYQHLISHVPSFPLISRAMGVPSVLSLHDYYGVCKNFTLLDADNRYCGVEERSEGDCDACLARSCGAQAGSQSRRRSLWRQSLESITVIHANTDGVRSRYERVYGSLASHLGWEVMGVPIPPASLPRSDQQVSSAALRVVIPGNFTNHKGADLICNAIGMLRDEPIQFSIAGRVTPDLVGRLKQTRNLKVHIIGQYKPEDVERLLQETDVSVHASIWPETYCLTLSEAMRGGVVPVVSKIGALGERVQDGVNGLVFSHTSPEQLAQCLMRLLRDRGLLAKLKLGRQPGDYVSENTHREWLLRVYDHLVSGSAGTRLSEGSFRGLTLADCGIFLNSPFWLRVGEDKERLIFAQVGKMTPWQRLAKYYKRHGFRVTLQRVAQEVEARMNRNFQRPN